MTDRKTLVALILPYAVWMGLMWALPQSVANYAVRTALTAAALGLSAVLLRGRWKLPGPGALLVGAAAGLAVCAVWVAPEQCAWYRRWLVFGDGGTVDAADASLTLLTVRLLGSALVISVAEELFFRKWLMDFGGFWWSVALFAVEHDRWFVGALAGIAYGLLARRKGLGSAIVAHALTNLLLGLYVIRTGSWQLW